MEPRGLIDPMDRMGPVALVFPMAEEAARVRARVRRRRRVVVPPGPSGAAVEATTGSLAGADVIVAVTGDGPRAARSGLEAVVRATTPRAAVFAGVAGALTPDLRSGEVVVSSRVTGTDGSSYPPCRALVDAASAAGLRLGLVATADRLVDSPGAKRAWADRLAEVGEAAVVDLESAVYAEVAGRHSVPWVAVRAVADAADEALPSVLEECRDEGGGIVRSEVMKHALTHPSTIPGLYRLRSRVEEGAEGLAEAIGALLRAADLRADRRARADVG